MDIIEIKFTPWDQVYYFTFPDKTDHSKLRVGDFLLVNTTLGMEIGEVVAIKDKDKKDLKNLDEIKPYIRIATAEDKEQVIKNNQDNKEKIKYCLQTIKRLNLDMKLVDCHCSYDGGRIIFAFIADGRVDFRDLVKELTKKYKKSIRLQQLGVRDEAKVSGDIGACGRCLCCRKFLKDLGNVSTDYCKDQMVAHRGSDRLSGVCGRLKCCLAYEQDFYKKELKKYPALGEKVKTKDGSGEVVSINILSGTYDIRIRDSKQGDVMVTKKI